MAIELAEPLDAAKYITDRESQLELLTSALASGDRAYVAHALGIVTRARGGRGIDPRGPTWLQREARWG